MILPLYIISNFLVAIYGGHNPPTNNEEYLFLTWVVLTLISLYFIKKFGIEYGKLRHSIRAIVFGLVVIGILFSFCGLYDFWKLYQDENFALGDNIPVAIIFSFICLSYILLLGLIKDRV